MAFARSRFGRLADDALVVLDAASFAEVARIAVKAPRRLAVLADGSLLVAGAESVHRLLPHDKRARVYARVPLFASSVLVPNRAQTQSLWVVHDFGGTLYPYELRATDSPLLQMGVPVALEGFDHRAFASLRDGSLLYTTADGLRRRALDGKIVAMRANIADVVRLLPARRIDRAWLVRSDRIELVTLGTALGVEVSIPIEATPFDVAADVDTVGVLLLHQGKSSEKRWSVDVYDDGGKRRFREAIPAAKGAGRDWVRSLTENRHIAVSANPPLVAVGGRTAVSVWSIDTGERVASHPDPLR